MTGRHLTPWTTCLYCGKRAYISRKEARKVARQIRSHHLSAYRCGDQWHIGHLPKMVTNGHATRAELGGAA